MLYVVLALVLGAFGLLIAALTTANTLWAWASVVVSVVAATLLVMDWLKGRRAKAQADEQVRPKAVTVGGTRHRRDAPPVEEPVDDDLPDFPDFPPEPVSAPASNLDFEPPVKLELPSGPENMGAPAPEDVRTVVTKAVAEPSADDRAETSVTPVQDDFAGEPGEEPTDASDLLVVAGLGVEVRVVDEHPRYHLATCVWLGNRPTIPVAVSEARQLGFTPCARCGPDAILAARHRARAK
ncbi:hypothetical protein [Actinophytocola sp.]|uniref:hypothetical protein n=1 Tax=Actinophytocola sp. TaxID=1872138 RepID=UPI002D3E8BDA|nr:hypothetical protein [Actinophytocola sp.]HYQ66018.1 hypothetical protein [Actinophytocola sp.]